MTLYLTDNTTPDTIAAAASSSVVHGCKLYPAGATTNSDSGVTDIGGMDDVFAAMAEHEVLYFYGEVTDSNIDIFDREAVFIDNILKQLLKRHPDLRVVLSTLRLSEQRAL